MSQPKGKNRHTFQVHNFGVEQARDTQPWELFVDDIEHDLWNNFSLFETLQPVIFHFGVGLALRASQSSTPILFQV